MSDVFQAQMTIATTATLIVKPTAGSQTVVIKNRGATTVYVGGENVTTSTGVEVKAGEDLAQGAFPLPAETALYGIVATGTGRLDVLAVEGD